MPYYSFMDESFVKTLISSVLGGLIGIVCGLVFAYTISFLGSFFAPEVQKIFVKQAPFFGMGLGSVIGVIFGAIIGLKQKS